MNVTQSSIRKRREELEQTQEEAAKALGCSLTTFCRWERGETMPMGLYRDAVDRWLKGNS